MAAGTQAYYFQVGLLAKKGGQSPRQRGVVIDEQQAANGHRRKYIKKPRHYQQLSGPDQPI
jgi:hypothetical protein